MTNEFCIASVWNSIVDFAEIFSDMRCIYGTNGFQLFAGTARRIGTGIREISLSGHILQRGTSEKHKIERS